MNLHFGRNVPQVLARMCIIILVLLSSILTKLRPHACVRKNLNVLDKVEITGVETAAQVLEAEQKILDIFSGEMTACKLLNDYP